MKKRHEYGYKHMLNRQLRGAGILQGFVSPSIEYLHLRMSTSGAVVAFPIRPLLENMLHAYKSRISLV